jgi:D-alanyl-D-alanine carboxypeptidase
MLKYKSFYLTFILIITSLFISTLAIYATGNQPSIGSESAVLIDGDTGQVLYQKNAHKSMYPASITKLMTALLAIESLNPEDTITFSEEAIDRVDSGGSRIGIHPGEELTVNDALHGLLLMSANEIANGLAEETSQSIDTFVKDMNTRAKELGAINTNFTNPHGLFNEEHQTTAYDMALITREIIRHPYFLEIMGHSTYEIPVTNKSDETRLLYQQHKMLNTKNDLKIYREDVIAGKVGYTRQSKNTLVTVSKKESRTLIAVIIRAEASDLYSDTASLLDYGFNEYKQVSISASDFVNTHAIQDNGISIGSMDLALANDVNLCIPINAEQEHLIYSLDLPTLSEQTFSSHDLFGNVTLTIGTLELMTLPLRIESIVYNAEESIDNSNSEITSPIDPLTPEENDEKNPWKLLISFIFIGVIGIIGFVFKII